MSTARIVLRSTNTYKTTVPFLCNRYVYAPCIQWNMLGKKDEQPRTAGAQLFLFHDPGYQHADVAMASLYSYRSLMQFRLLNNIPLGAKDGRIIMKYLLPAMTIAGIHQPDRFSPLKKLWIEKDPTSFDETIMKAEASFRFDELNRFKNREKKFFSALRKLGCSPLKKISPGYGASIHYAGCLPFSPEERNLHLMVDGRLGNHKNVYVADGSGFNFLPAKGITLTLMANAHRVAVKSINT